MAQRKPKNTKPNAKPAPKASAPKPPKAAPRSDFDKWKDGIDKAVAENDRNWNYWDCEIQTAVNEYNRHLAGKSGYIPLDWRLIKAIIWTESGPYFKPSEWKHKPMQIGNAGDPGLAALLSDKQGGDLIVPPAWRGRLTAQSCRTIGAHNIRAGIGYLLMMMAYYDTGTVPDADAAVYEVTVKQGDSLDKIAKAQGTTVGILKDMNVGVTPQNLKPKQVLKYRKGAVQRVITGWRDKASFYVIAERYNSKRGYLQEYANRLSYAFGAIHKVRGSTQCGQ
jgi:hypothetical protein